MKNSSDIINHTQHSITVINYIFSKDDLKECLVGLNGHS